MVEYANLPREKDCEHGGSFKVKDELLFFFLILVVLFNNECWYNRGDDTLLFFFLLLIILFDNYNLC